MIVKKYLRGRYSQLKNPIKKWLYSNIPFLILKLRYFKWRILFVNKFFDKKQTIPLFRYVEIETINRCNWVCPFCPVNKKIDTREPLRMDENLFLNIIAQLKQINYSGKIALHSNNEPFLDGRIISFAKIVKQELPRAFQQLYTNGTLLTMDKFTEIISSLDELVIDNYNDKLELNPNVKEIHKYCISDPVINRKVKITLRKQNQVLSSRGGQAPNKKNPKETNLPCYLPFQQLVIRPDGKLSLCCCDALGKYTLGDLNQQTIYDAWNSAQYKSIRNKLISKNRRKNIDLCNKCDATLIF